MSCLDFDVEDFLDDASTEALLAELIERGKYQRHGPNVLSEAYEALCDGDIEFARAILGALLAGREPPNRKAQMAEIREGKHPFLRARQ